MQVTQYRCALEIGLKYVLNEGILMTKGQSIIKKWMLLPVTLLIGVIAIRWGKSLRFRSIQFIIRSEFLLLIYVFLAANCLLPLKRLYGFLYKFRVFACILLFGFLVANNVNFSSVGMWNKQIQPSTNVQNGGLIYGTPRAIRSDEWLVNVPRMMAGSYNHYGMYNDVVRAEKAESLSATGYFLDYCALAVPDSWGYYIFGPERGLSFMWSFRMVFGFLFSFELCLILSGRKKVLSFLGAAIIWFSSYNMWWSLQSTMFAATAVTVLFYYMIVADTKARRLIYGIATAIAAANFTVVLYPAWQVPFAWTVLFLAAWIIFDNRQHINRYRWKDYAIIVLSLLFAVSLVLRFLAVDKNYIHAVMNTAYPGNRFLYGGFSLTKGFGYLAEMLAFQGKLANPSETGCFFLAFPLGIVMLFQGLVQKKGRDSQLWFLAIPTIFTLLYCCFELPKLLCSLTLMKYSTPARAVDVLQYQCVLAIMAAYGKCRANRGLPIFIDGALTVAGVYPAISTGMEQVPGSRVFILVAGIVSCIAAMILITGYYTRISKVMIYIISLGLIVNGMMVNPIMKGIGSITSKPLYREVRKIVTQDPEAKWIGMNDLTLPEYLISCGARTVNSVNYIPNMEFWKRFDPSGEQQFIYNRYAHIVIDISKKDMTSMDLVQGDYIHLQVSEKDFSKLNAKYVLSRRELPSGMQKHANLLYVEDGVYIYQVK